MASQHSSILFTVAGIAFFMFGMTLASDNLQKLAANRIRDLVSRLAHRPHLGVAIGIALTVLIQSSGAVTSMLVGLGSAGVVTLAQVMSVILGTAIGTTVTVQLLSLDIAQFGLPIFAGAFLIQFFSSARRTLRLCMGAVMGFGLIFWGLELVGIGTEALKEVSHFTVFLNQLSANPILTVIVTAVFTAIVHSSAVTIGFAMSLAGSDIITLRDAVFWVYGANIGTTGIALLASVGGNHVGRQVAWAHCLFKVLGVAVFYFFTTQFANFMGTENIERDIANIHTVFNVLAAILFYPFISKGVQLVERFVRPSPTEREFSVKFLDRSAFQSTSVALAHAEREIFRMSDIVFSMVRDSLKLFRNQDPELEELIREKDKKVDILHREISLFLAHLMEGAASSQQQQMMQMMMFSADVESVGDVIDNNILDLARKKHALKVEFSPQGWKDLEDIHKLVVELTSLSISCFQRQDKDLASKVIYLKRAVRKAEKKLRESHITRLVEGRPDTINTSSIHIDALSEYRRIAGVMSNHAYAYLKDTDEYNLLPRRE